MRTRYASRIAYAEALRIAYAGRIDQVQLGPRLNPPPPPPISKFPIIIPIIRRALRECRTCRALPVKCALFDAPGGNAISYYHSNYSTRPQECRALPSKCALFDAPGGDVGPC